MQTTLGITLKTIRANCSWRRGLIMSTKRKPESDSPDGTLSPPPLKKKVESTTNKRAVANFFTPVSQKSPERLSWRIVNNSLLIGRYNVNKTKDEHEAKRRKVAAFDFDSTLITTSSGNVFGRDASDWKWWDASVPSRLKSLYAEGYLVIVLSNQSGISLNPKSESKSVKGDPKRLADFKTKAGHVFSQLDMPISVYAATTKDHFRKPRTGMWKELLEDYDLDIGDGPDLKESFFIGDAAGREAKKGIKADHSCSDRDFAANAGIDFKTPEEYFLNQEAEPFQRTFDPLMYIDQTTDTLTDDGSSTSKSVIGKLNPLDIVLLCGSPGSGKSTFYWDYLEPLGYSRVNQDTLKTRDKCIKVAAEHLSSQQSVAVDNTNADTETRSKWVEVARKFDVPIRCVSLETPASVCRHNDAVRALNEGKFNPEKRMILPGMAFTGFASRYKEPTLEEGFQDIVKVPFKFRGDDDGRSVWSRYWT